MRGREGGSRQSWEMTRRGSGRGRQRDSLANFHLNKPVGPWGSLPSPVPAIVVVIVLYLHKIVHCFELTDMIKTVILRNL